MDGGLESGESEATGSQRGGLSDLHASGPRQAAPDPARRHQVRRPRIGRRPQPRGRPWRQGRRSQGDPAFPRRRVDPRLHGPEPGQRRRRARGQDPPHRAPARDPRGRLVARPARDAVRRRMDDARRRRGAAAPSIRHRAGGGPPGQGPAQARERLPRQARAGARRGPDHWRHARLLARGAHIPRPLPRRGQHHPERRREVGARRHHPSRRGRLRPARPASSRPVGERDHGQRPRPGLHRAARRPRQGRCPIRRREPAARDDPAHGRHDRAAHRRPEPDGRRAPARRQPRQRDHPARIDPRPGADDPQVQGRGARHGRPDARGQLEPRHVGVPHRPRSSDA